MNDHRLTLVCFSPTGTTRRTLEAIAEGMGFNKPLHVDLTLPPSPGAGITEIDSGIALIGVPVYAGRVPLTAIERLKKIKARKIPAVIVVVYGNRAFEDALLELKELSIDAGFTPVAGAAFIGEHSFSGKQAPVALGRPDEKDLEAAREFGKAVGHKLDSHGHTNAASPLDVPGNVPHRERKPLAGIAPVSLEALCTLCGTCESVCPTGAVTVDVKLITDAARCILCHACVKRCPTGARVVQAEPVRAIVNRLVTNCMDRREPQTFL
ncbi:MAG: 4Fe-4S binding protein [Spirochaetes bacterium]|nr:4Fe-4S binding protein [Spirochaetota bacterium]